MILGIEDRLRGACDYAGEVGIDGVQIGLGEFAALPRFPAGQLVIVLDMATSEAAMGKIRMADKANAPIPSTWAVTADGEPTRNPAQAIKGMLLPAAGAKGFGMSLMIDLMCGLLSGGASGPAVRPLYGDFNTTYDCSHLFIAIDVGHFCDPDWFRSESATAAQRIRTAKRALGVERLFTPGEPEWERRQQSKQRVTLDPAVTGMLIRYGQELGVVNHPFNNAERD